MRKLVVLALAVASMILGLGISANSANAACGTKCLSKQIKKLKTQVGSLSAQVGSLSTQVQSLQALNGQVQNLNTQVQDLNAFESCILFAPVTSYFGYDYFNGVDSFYTSALDFTDPGDPVDAWAAALQPGTCGSPTLATAGAANAKSGFRAFQPDVSHQRKP